MDQRQREAQLRVDMHIGDRIGRAYEDIWDDIQAERMTFDEAKRALANWDLDDHFQEWWDEGE